MACGYQYIKSAAKADFVEHDEEKGPESNGQDTGENSALNVERDIQYHDELETILKEEEEEDKDPQMAAKQDVDDLDTIAYNPEESEEEPFNTAIDDTYYCHGQTGHHCIHLR